MVISQLTRTENKGLFIVYISIYFDVQGLTLFWDFQNNVSCKSL
jgi:hypothetical protein